VEPGARLFIRRHDRIERAKEADKERPQLPFLARGIEQVFLGEHSRNRWIAHAQGGCYLGLVDREGPRRPDHCLREDLAPVRGGTLGRASLRHDFLGKDTPSSFLRKEGVQALPKACGVRMRNGSERAPRRARCSSARSLVIRKSARATSAASRNFWSSGSRQRGNPERCGSGSVASMR